MKVAFVVIVLTLSCPALLLAQLRGCPECSYKLTGKISDVNRSETSASVTVRLKLQFEVKNVGTETLIFWNRSSSDTMGEAGVVGVTISRSGSFDEPDIIGRNSSLPGNLYGEAWSTLRTTLDKLTPPPNATVVLEPGRSWTFASDAALGVSKDKLADSMVWIKLRYASWSPNIELKGKHRASELVFGRALQKRWETTGYLVLEELVSEPIEVQLR